ncbi:amino acid ABC transporter substrate-binding protein [Pseudomonas sp. PIC25]|uniref:substrate-binding periplasmic protein n=1 Tax=Pseudomonas sp. PIC25 TaxID=1958773 RepID=UPI000BABB18C|nr:transporter substrate-binding domain-containing protein [Pseudomonas sp. PIC25]PAU64101.1 amino acid ABC transporter substrate-binding protein [Pseudomonas sp. PIC25]
MGRGVLGWGLLWLAVGVSADPVRMGFGTHKPPYIFENEHRGLEYDIVDAAFRSAGYTIEAHYLPMERLHLMLKRGELDGIATTNRFSQLDVAYSDVYIQYHNVAAALASRKYDIHSIADLGRYSVSAFQRARYLLGPEFQSMAESNPRYREEALQIARNRLLYSGRIDVVVGDLRILNYFNREVADQVDVTQPLTLYQLFPPTPYHVGFRTASMRDKFNRGLATIRSNGTYQAIERRYEAY